MAEALSRYEQWLKSGAPGRLKLEEPEGQNICSVVAGRGLVRFKSGWRRWCLILATVIPGNAWKVFWFRRSGVKVGKNVFISHGAKLDWLAPWLITLEDGCVLGYEAMVVVHLYFKNKLVLRRVVVGQEAVVGLRASVCASMGPGSILSPGSVLLTEAPAGAVMSGNPAIEVNFSVRTTLDF